MFDDVYFVMHCLYNAETELYDRYLTDARDRYDPTSAWINVSNEVRSESNAYAKRLYRWCRRQIEYETGRPFNFMLWKESVRGYDNLTAQGWVDLYKYLLGEAMEYEENLRKE